MLAALLLATVVPTAVAPAHEIPSRVTLIAFVKPEGDRLHVLLRVPLAAMRDMEWPQRGLGYLDIERAAPLLRDAAQLWLAGYLEVFEETRRLDSAGVVAVRVSLPSDRSFGSYESALAHVRAPPLESGVDLPPAQALMDVLLEYRITSADARFSLRPAFAHLGASTTTVLRFVTPNGTERAFQYSGNPGLVRLDPRWHQAAFRFVALGFSHILDGIDHLLFLLGLVIPFRRLRPLIAIITSFTVAHSVTLIASASGFAPSALWFPPFIEALIALSIVYMAVENIVGAKFQRRWIIAFAFGLVHGFGFSFALRESLQFAGGHLVSSLLAFNVGVELGQLLVVALAVPLLSWLFRRIDERLASIILSALLAHTAWHWLTDRVGVLQEYDFAWPVWDAALLVNAMRVAMVLLALGGLLWLLSGLFGRLVGPLRSRDSAADLPR